MPGSFFCNEEGLTPWPAPWVNVCIFLQAVRARHAARPNVENRGSAGTSRLEGLRVACDLINAPAAAALARMEVQTAAIAPEASARRKEFNLPVALILLLEDLCLGPKHFATARPGRTPPATTPTLTALARDIWVYIGLGVRRASVARMHAEAISPPLPYLGGACVVVCASTGDKSAVSAGMEPAEHWVLAKGFLPGVEL